MSFGEKKNNNNNNNQSVFDAIVTWSNQTGLIIVISSFMHVDTAITKYIVMHFLCE